MEFQVRYSLKIGSDGYIYIFGVVDDIERMYMRISIYEVFHFISSVSLQFPLFQIELSFSQGEVSTNKEGLFDLEDGKTKREIRDIVLYNLIISYLKQEKLNYSIFNKVRLSKHFAELYTEKQIEPPYHSLVWITTYHKTLQKNEVFDWS